MLRLLCAGFLLAGCGDKEEDTAVESEEAVEETESEESEASSEEEEVEEGGE